MMDYFILKIHRLKINLHVKLTVCNNTQTSFGVKETPQEQPVSAMGLSETSNEERIISSLYSIVDPLIISRVIESETTLIPSCSNTIPSSISISSSRITSKAYQNPEQPPPSTKIRRHPYFSLFFSCKNLILITHESLMWSQKDCFDLSKVLIPYIFCGYCCQLCAEENW